MYRLFANFDDVFVGNCKLNLKKSPVLPLSKFKSFHGKNNE